MPVEPIGIKWMVFTNDGLFKGIFACKGEAEKVDAELRQVEATETAEKGDEVTAEGGNENEEVKEPLDAFEPEGEVETEVRLEAPLTFPCPRCEFVSKSQVGLSSHMRAKHPAPSKPDF